MNDKDYLSSKDANALWNLFAIPTATFCVWFWVDFTDPAFSSGLPFMQSFRDSEVFIIALPTTVVLTAVLMILAGWTVKAKKRELESEKLPLRKSYFLPTLPKMELYGKKGGIVRWAYFLVMMLGPMAITFQSFYDMMGSSIYHEGKLVAESALELFALPPSYFLEALGSGPAFRFNDANLGKEAFPPVQIWAYSLAAVALPVIVAVALGRVLSQKTVSQKEAENEAVLIETKEDPDETKSERNLGRVGGAVITIAALTGILGFSATLSAAEEGPSISVTVRDSFAREELRNHLPAEIQISDQQKLPNMGIWWNVRIENLVAHPSTDSFQLSFLDSNRVEISVRGSVTAELKYDYKHTWVANEMRGIGKFKTDIPILRSETRTKVGNVAVPFELKATFDVSLSSEAASPRLTMRGDATNSQAKIGKIDVTNANEHLGFLIEKIGGLLAEDQVEEVYLDAISKTQELALAGILPKVILSHLEKATLRIEDGMMTVIIP